MDIFGLEPGPVPPRVSHMLDCLLTLSPAYVHSIFASVRNVLRIEGTSHPHPIKPSTLVAAKTAALGVLLQLIRTLAA